MTISRFCCSLLLFHLSITLLIGQDIRLSRSPYTTELPESIRIQSADSIDGITLAVWGTTRFDAGNDSAMVPTLRMQIIQGGKAIGVPLDLLSERARPARYLRVIALVDRFVVVYNDLRGVDSGVYATEVDLTGTVLGVEKQFSRNPISLKHGSKGLYVLGDRARGMLLLWYTEGVDDTGFVCRRIDAQGRGSGMERYLGRSARSILRYKGLPGAHLIVMDNAPSYMVAEDGRVDDRTVRASHLLRPYYIDKDGTFYRLAEDSLERYRSIFDSLPVVVIPLSLPKHLGGSELIARDTLGELQVYYLTNQSYRDSTAFGLYSAPVMSDSVAGEHQLLQRMGVPASGTVVWYYAPYIAVHTIGCYNTSTVIASQKYSRTYPYVDSDGMTVTRRDTQTVSFTLSVASNGAIRDTRQDELCITLDDVEVARLSTRDSSMISVRAGSATIRTTTSVAFFSFPQRQPAVFSNDTMFQAAWIAQNVSSQGFALFQIDTLASYGASFISSRAPSELCNHGPSLGPSEQSDIQHYQSSSYYRYDRTAAYLTHGYGGRYVRTGRITWTPFGCSAMFTGIAGPEGWREDLVAGKSGYYVSRFYVRGGHLGYERNSGLIYMLYETEAYPATYATPGKPGWSAPVSISGFTQLVPIDAHRYILLNDILGLIRNDSGGSRSFTLPKPESPAVHERLLGDRFLRRYYSVDHSTYYLRIYSVDGDSLYGVRIPVPSGAHDPYMVQNREDSTIVLLWGSKTGVRAMRLDKNLGILSHDTAVSSTRDSVALPSGVWRGDTLYVVWEDFRYQKSVIYMAAFAGFPHIDSLGAPGNATSMTLYIESLTPNPARGVAVATLYVPAGTIFLEVFNGLGEKVMSHTIQSSGVDRLYVPLEIDGLAVGAYHVVVRSGNLRHAMPLRVY